MDWFFSLFGVGGGGHNSTGGPPPSTNSNTATNTGTGGGSVTVTPGGVSGSLDFNIKGVNIKFSTDKPPGSTTTTTTPSTTPETLNIPPWVYILGIFGVGAALVRR